MKKTGKGGSGTDCLLGTAVERVEHDGHRWLLHLSGSICLAIECHWQIIREGRVRLASGDHGQQYDLDSPIDAVAQAASLLDYRSVVLVYTDDASADIALTFDGDVCLRTFNDSSGFEAWNLSGPRGPMFTAQGGGNLVEW